MDGKRFTLESHMGDSRGPTTRSSRPAALRLLYKIVGILTALPTYQCCTRAAGG